MNKKKLLVWAFGAALLVTACRKNDMIEHTAPAPVAVAAADSTTASSWASFSNWTAEPQEKYTVYSNTVNASAINGAVASKGLVLVYKKTGNSIIALPGEEKGNGNSYFWYYQVSNGKLSITADAYGNAQAPGNAQSFKYFILTAEKLAELEGKGFSKAELMTLTYENAAAILK
jgi:hypothetical protein